MDVNFNPFFLGKWSFDLKESDDEKTSLLKSLFSNKAWICFVCTLPLTAFHILGQMHENF
jgi:hypothetical protein